MQTVKLLKSDLQLRCTPEGLTPVVGLRKRWPALLASPMQLDDIAGTWQDFPSPHCCHFLLPNTPHCDGGGLVIQSRLHIEG